MFKQILYLCVSVLLLAMVGHTRSKESGEKKTADAAVAHAQEAVEPIRAEIDTAIEGWILILRRLRKSLTPLLNISTMTSRRLGKT